jgi:hypothetical protein
VAKETHHFTEEEWVDFTNQQLAVEKKRAMQSHLDDGCRSCAADAGVWKLLRTVGRCEPSYEPPEWAIRYVKNTFAVTSARQFAAVKRDLRIPLLVFDSLWQPSSPGVRSTDNASRQMRYKAQEVAVELRFGSELGSDRINLVGQVFRTIERPPSDHLTGKRVTVTSESGKLIEGVTNRFGEFQMSFLPPEKDLSLYFEMGEERDLYIPLDLGGLSRSDLG